MDYSELREIIRHIKHIIPCNICKHLFSNENIQVLSTFHNEWLFHFRCHNCKNQLLVHVIIIHHLKKNNLNISVHNVAPISPNDVIDIHNFLKQFDGDFKKLFSA